MRLDLDSTKSVRFDLGKRREEKGTFAVVDVMQLFWRMISRFHLFIKQLVRAKV